MPVADANLADGTTIVLVGSRDIADGDRVTIDDGRGLDAELSLEPLAAEPDDATEEGTEASEPASTADGDE